MPVLFLLSCVAVAGVVIAAVLLKRRRARLSPRYELRNYD